MLAPIRKVFTVFTGCNRMGDRSIKKLPWCRIVDGHKIVPIMSKIREGTVKNPA